MDKLDKMPDQTEYIIDKCISPELKENLIASYQSSIENNEKYLKQQSRLENIESYYKSILQNYYCLHFLHNGKSQHVIDKIKEYKEKLSCLDFILCQCGILEDAKELSKYDKINNIVNDTFDPFDKPILDCVTKHEIEKTIKENISWVIDRHNIDENIKIIQSLSDLKVNGNPLFEMDFLLKHYLDFTDEDLELNRKMAKQEKENKK